MLLIIFVTHYISVNNIIYVTHDNILMVLQNRELCVKNE